MRQRAQALASVVAASAWAGLALVAVGPAPPGVPWAGPAPAMAASAWAALWAFVILIAPALLMARRTTAPSPPRLRWLIAPMLVTATTYALARAAMPLRIQLPHESAFAAALVVGAVASLVLAGLRGTPRLALTCGALVAALWAWLGPIPQVAPEAAPVLVPVLAALAGTLSLQVQRWWPRPLVRAGLLAAAAQAVAVATVPVEPALHAPAGLGAVRALRAVGLGRGGLPPPSPAPPLGPLPRSHPRLVPGASPPDVVLISVDALRRDHVGPGHTPHIEAWARGALVFEDALAAAPLTDLSLRSTFTGWPPSDFDDGGVLVGMDRPLADLFAAVGYRTYALHSIPDLGELVTLGFQAGNASLAARHAADARASSAPELVALALDLLNSPRAAPRLLWLHILDVHAPFVPHPGLERFGGDVRGRYAQEVAWVDAALRPLLERLDDSVVTVVFADHGEYLGERGKRGHDLTLYPEVLRVPLLIKGPGIPPGRRTEGVSLVDVLPTLLQAAGVQGVEARAGISLLGPLPRRARLAEGRRPGGRARYAALIEPEAWLHCSETDAVCHDVMRPGDAASFIAPPARLLTRLSGYRAPDRQAGRKAMFWTRWGAPNDGGAEARRP